MTSLINEELVLYNLPPLAQREIPQKIRELFDHPGRQASYMATRTALKKALENQGISVQNWDELLIHQNHHLKNYPDILVSLSDTQTFGCAFIASKKTYRSIGVDIELCSREIKDSVLKFFINSDDKYSDPLKLWTLKEAAFKAISPICPNEELSLKMIIVNDRHFHLAHHPELSGKLSLEKKVCEKTEFWVAQAYLSL